MIYENNRISVIVDDGTVVVDGEAYHCSSYVDAAGAIMDLHALQWVPGDPVPGHISRKYGDSHGFGQEQFHLFGPYIAAWEQARDATLKAAAEIQRQRDEHAASVQAAIEEERKASQARFDEQARALADRKAHDDAWQYLHMTDHEIIKAVERMFARQPGDAHPVTELEQLLDKRQAARETIKQERARLGIKP